jgi:hypothetical protein
MTRKLVIQDGWVREGSSWREVCDIKGSSKKKILDERNMHMELAQVV